MLVAAEAEARKNGWQEAIVVMDSSGRLLDFWRMDNTQLAIIATAIGKALMANNVKRLTKALRIMWLKGARPRDCSGCPA